MVARDAPQEFRDLVHDLLLLKDILFIVHRKVTRDPDLYGDPTKRVLQCCFDALSDFSTLVAKYEKLGKQAGFRPSSNPFSASRWAIAQLIHLRSSE